MFVGLTSQIVTQNKPELIVTRKTHRVLFTQNSQTFALHKSIPMVWCCINSGLNVYSGLSQTCVVLVEKGFE